MLVEQHLADKAFVREQLLAHVQVGDVAHGLEAAGDVEACREELLRGERLGHARWLDGDAGAACGWGFWVELITW